MNARCRSAHWEPDEFPEHNQVTIRWLLETEHDRTKVYTSNHFKAKKTASSEGAAPNPPFRNLVSFPNKHGCFAARNNHQACRDSVPIMVSAKSRRGEEKADAGLSQPTCLCQLVSSQILLCFFGCTLFSVTSKVALDKTVFMSMMSLMMSPMLSFHEASLNTLSKIEDSSKLQGFRLSGHHRSPTS